MSDKKITIEIGPNLMSMLWDFMRLNYNSGRVPGYLLKESFRDLIEKAVKEEIEDDKP